jgi:hypothetical protein
MSEMLRCRLQHNDHSIMAMQNIGWIMRHATPMEKQQSSSMFSRFMA